jgi:peptidoglycan/LPS O-acetylase OafA/YrhL
MFFMVNWSADGRIKSLPAASLLGALTYPLYLVHAHIGYMLLSKFGSTEYRFFSYALTIGFVFVLAWLIHEVVEVRWSAFWRSCFELVVGAAERPINFVLQSSARWRFWRVAASPDLCERAIPVQGTDANAHKD